MFDAFAARNAGRNAEVVNEIVGKSARRYSMDYESDIDALNKGTFDAMNNTHLRVLEHTPKIFIDKARAKDRTIVMSWDIAYLAMKRKEESSESFRGISKKYDEALEKGNYHGLGADFMKKLPQELKNPLYIVKQANGRICAVTELLHKSKRPIFAVIELDAYTPISQEWKNNDDTYNLIVTVSNGQPRYFKNNVFNGEIVYNKNEEDPAYFISRLQSLNKLTPRNDLAGSSKDIISDPEQKINPPTKILQKILAERPPRPLRTLQSCRGSQSARILTVGQLKKFLANYSRAKTYSRKDALGVVDKIDAGKALNENTRNDIADGKKAPTGSLPCRGFWLLCRLVQNVDKNTCKSAGDHNDSKRSRKNLDLKIFLFLMVHLFIPQLPDFFAS